MRYPILTTLSLFLAVGTTQMTTAVFAQTAVSPAQQATIQPSTTYTVPTQTTPQQNPSTTMVTLPTNNSSFAVTLAREAGLIAGAAQACNQDTALLAARLDEAINAVAQSPVDSSDAVAAFQQSTKEAFGKQSAGRPIPCEVVIKDYRQIPLLRDDYKEVVLSALKADQTHAMPNQIATTPNAQQPNPQQLNQVIAPTPATGQIK